MLELLLNKLPGGDSGSTRPLVRVQITNTGEGVGDAKVYEVRVTAADGPAERYRAIDRVRTHRLESEDVLVLAHRALGELIRRGNAPVT